MTEPKLTIRPSTSSLEVDPIDDDVDLEPQIGSLRLTDHSYCCSSSVLQNKYTAMQVHVRTCKTKISDLEEQLKQLKIAKSTMTIDDIKHNDLKVGVQFSTSNFSGNISH